MDLAEAMTLIRAEDAQLVEHRAAVDDLVVEPGALLTEDGDFQFTEKSLARLCDRFDHRPSVASKYLASLPDRLRMDVLRHHLSEGIEGDGLVSLFVRGAEVVGFGRSALVTLRGPEVVEAACEGIGDQPSDLEITRLSIQDESLRFELVTHRVEREIRRGDVVSGGVHVNHSLIGGFATKVEPFLYRLVCTNGAIHRECLAPREVPRTRRLPASHPRARAQQIEQVCRLTADALTQVNGRLQGLERLTTEPVDFDHFSSNWLRRSRLSPPRLLPLLRQAWAEEGAEGTAYGVMNAFTRLATHNTDLSRNVRDVLARLGGLLALGHSRLCPRCWSLIASSN
jgi:hypothetical protein